MWVFWDTKSVFWVSSHESEILCQNLDSSWCGNGPVHDSSISSVCK